MPLRLPRRMTFEADMLPIHFYYKNQAEIRLYNSLGVSEPHWPSLKVLPWYISTTTSMVTTFTFSGRHRQLTHGD